MDPETGGALKEAADSKGWAVDTSDIDKINPATDEAYLQHVCVCVCQLFLQLSVAHAPQQGASGGASDIRLPVMLPMKKHIPTQGIQP